MVAERNKKTELTIYICIVYTIITHSKANYDQMFCVLFFLYCIDETIVITQTTLFTKRTYF